MSQYVYLADGTQAVQVQIAGTNSSSSGSSGALGVDVTAAEAILPIDLQSHLQTTIQTHNAVSVAISGGQSVSSYYDMDGFDRIAVQMNSTNGGTSDTEVRIYWSTDGINMTTWQGVTWDGVITHDKKVTTEMPSKARYVAVCLRNLNGTTAATMSGWAFLKA